jgi:hypothetical protein
VDVGAGRSPLPYTRPVPCLGPTPDTDKGVRVQQRPLGRPVRSCLRPQAYATPTHGTARQYCQSKYCAPPVKERARHHSLESWTASSASVSCRAVVPSSLECVHVTTHDFDKRTWEKAIPSLLAVAGMDRMLAVYIHRITIRAGVTNGLTGFIHANVQTEPIASYFFCMCLTRHA